MLIKQYEFFNYVWEVNLENDAKLTSYNTFTFKSEAEMLLHIKYWDDEGEKVFKLLKSKDVQGFVIQEFGTKRVYLKPQLY